MSDGTSAVVGRTRAPIGEQARRGEPPDPTTVYPKGLLSTHQDIHKQCHVTNERIIRKSQRVKTKNVPVRVSKQDERGTKKKKNTKKGPV